MLPNNLPTIVGVPQARFLAGCLTVSACLALPTSASAEECLYSHYAPAQVATSGPVAAIAIADYNGDQIDDTWIAEASGLLRIRLGAPAGQPTPEVFLNVGLGPVALAFGDLDGDGDQDGLVALDGGSYQAPGQGLRLLRNLGPGNWSVDPLLAFPAGSHGPVGAFLEDANGDGRLDALVALKYFQSTSGLLVGLGDGNLGFNFLATQALPAATTAVAAADLNGDGSVDLAVLYGGLVAYAARVYAGLGDGSFQPAGPGLSAGFYSSGIVAADLDQDGATDFAVGSKYSVATFHNDGIGQFSPWNAKNYGYYIKSLASGDMDNDGDQDLVAVSGSSMALRTLTNDGQGQLTVTSSVPTSLQSYALALGDTNGDGFLDAWCGDVVAGSVHGALSYCVVASYGNAKPTSAGNLPVLGAAGAASLLAGFELRASGLPSAQAAWIGLAFGPANLPLFGGQLLLDSSLQLITTVSGPGSGNQLVCDGALSLSATAQTLAQFALGTQLFAQVLVLDPLQSDGTAVGLTNGLRFQIVL